MILVLHTRHEHRRFPTVPPAPYVISRKHRLSVLLTSICPSRFLVPYVPCLTLDTNYGGSVISARYHLSPTFSSWQFDWFWKRIYWKTPLSIFPSFEGITYRRSPKSPVLARTSFCLSYLFHLLNSSISLHRTEFESIQRFPFCYHLPCLSPFTLRGLLLDRIFLVSVCHSRNIGPGSSRGQYLWMVWGLLMNHSFSHKLRRGSWQRKHIL